MVSGFTESALSPPLEQLTIATAASIRDEIFNAFIVLISFRTIIMVVIIKF